MTVTPSPPEGSPIGLLEQPIALPDLAGPADATPTSKDSVRRGRLARFVRGRESDAAWVRPTLLTLLALAAVLYLWDLGASGWGNSFYSAAVQAGTKSWKAFFFGSSDSSNFITVDKPPASLWPMEISARIFGLNSWSILVPQALEGVATVGVVYLTVRRWFTAQAALLAGAVVALSAWEVVVQIIGVPPDASTTGRGEGSLASRVSGTWDGAAPHLHVVGLALVCAVAGAVLLGPLRRRLGLGNERSRGKGADSEEERNGFLHGVF